ncbi:MAG TPA: hypothetical protein VGR54_09200 [Nitrosopumilaceae archaeon]|nr:hypothetical protein [Nitrosopumilaceae archaeon]
MNYNKIAIGITLIALIIAEKIESKRFKSSESCRTQLLFWYNFSSKLSYIDGIRVPSWSYFGPTIVKIPSSDLPSL